MSKYYESNNGLMHDSYGNVIMATTHNENGKDIVFMVDEYNALDLFNVEQTIDLFEEFDNSNLKFKINIFNNETKILEEASSLKLPLYAEKDMAKLNYFECLEKIDKVPHVVLWFDPSPDAPDKYSNCWIWVELPKEIEKVKYVPIIIHRTGGVSVHPYYHKYFLRSFDKRTRHLILGFCYTYGPIIDRQCSYAFEDGKDEINERDLNHLQYNTFKYKDSDAPKRINMGPVKDDGYFKPSLDDYDRWLKELKKRK